MPLLGIISDTHNYFDPRIPKLFAGVDHILHGGDVGQPKILHALEEIAPVTAVLGNTDDPGFGYRLTELIEVAGIKALVHHIVNPHALVDSLADRIRRDTPDLVVFGHTHKPFSERINGALFLNPGYAGHSRFGMERSVALLRCERGKMQPQFLPMPG
jgi:putative phosphoesterase